MYHLFIIGVAVLAVCQVGNTGTVPVSLKDSGAVPAERFIDNDWNIAMQVAMGYMTDECDEEVPVPAAAPTTAATPATTPASTTTPEPTIIARCIAEFGTNLTFYQTGAGPLTMEGIIITEIGQEAGEDVLLVVGDAGMSCQSAVTASLADSLIDYSYGMTMGEISPISLTLPLTVPLMPKFYISPAATATADTDLVGRVIIPKLQSFGPDEYITDACCIVTLD